MEKESVFSKEEYARYSRHFILPEVNVAGQKKMKQAKVLVVGSGGLGSPVLLYLAAAGIGTIGIVDFDTIDKTNLQRQVLFSSNDEGKPKAVQAKQRLLELNPHIKINLHQVKIDSSNALEIVKAYDVVIDGTDNFPTRYLMNDACVLAGKPNVYGSVFRFEGQMSVFNYQFEDGTFGPNYRDIFPEPPAPGEVPNCSEGGVLGVLPGIIGCLQANEAIKIICGIGEVLAGKLLLLDTLTLLTRKIKIKKQADNPISGENPSIKALIDYEAFCNINAPVLEKNTQYEEEIDVIVLSDMLETKETLLRIIDVREPYEYEISNIGGELIPLGEIEKKRLNFNNNETVVVHCRTGIRSAKAIKKLQATHKNTKFLNLKGGILEWIAKVDSSLVAY